MKPPFDIPQIKVPQFKPAMVLWILLGLLLVWIVPGTFYFVEPDEEGVVTRFGKFHRIASPGLHFKFPSPIEHAATPAIRQVRRAEIGFRTSEGRPIQKVPAESLMLTGDQNIIDINLVVLRGKTLVAGAIPAAMVNGCTMTTTLLAKDISHKTQFPVFTPGGGFAMAEMSGAGDIIMVPDPATFRILPWAEKTGWMLCDIYFPSGARIPFSTRQIFKDALSDLADDGFDFVTGLEVEFHVFRLDDPKLAPKNAVQPADPPEVSLITINANDISVRSLSITYNSRGNAYADLGEYRRAIEDYDQALRLDPNYVFAHYNRGLVYLSLDEYRRAIGVFLWENSVQ